MSFNRDKLMISIRPEIPSIDMTKDVSTAESFQNKTLRPILMFQDELIKNLFQAKSKNPQLTTLNVTDQRHRITKLLESHTVLRNQLIGLVIALMSQKELNIYMANESEMKKRIKTMMIERLIHK